MGIDRAPESGFKGPAIGRRRSRMGCDSSTANGSGRDQWPRHADFALRHPTAKPAEDAGCAAKVAAQR